MPEENLQQAYQRLSEKFEMPEYEVFAEKMKLPENRRQAYDNLAKHYRMPSYATFESKLVTAAGDTQPFVHPRAALVKPFVDRISEDVGSVDHPLAKVGIGLLSAAGTILDIPLAAAATFKEGTTFAEEIARPVALGERGERALPESVARPERSFTRKELERRKRLIQELDKLGIPIKDRMQDVMALDPEARGVATRLMVEVFGDLGGILGAAKGVLGLAKARKVVKNKAQFDAVIENISRKPKDVQVKVLEEAQENVTKIMDQKIGRELKERKIQDTLAGVAAKLEKSEVDVAKLPDVRRSEEARRLGEIAEEVEQARPVEVERARKAGLKEELGIEEAPKIRQAEPAELPPAKAPEEPIKPKTPEQKVEEQAEAVFEGIPKTEKLPAKKAPTETPTVVGALRKAGLRINTDDLKRFGFGEGTKENRDLILKIGSKEGVGLDEAGRQLVEGGVIEPPPSGMGHAEHLANKIKEGGLTVAGQEAQLAKRAKEAELPSISDLLAETEAEKTGVGFGGRTRPKVAKENPNKVVDTGGGKKVEVAEEIFRPRRGPDSPDVAYDNAISGKRPSEVSKKGMTPEQGKTQDRRISARKQTQTDRFRGFSKEKIEPDAPSKPPPPPETPKAKAGEPALPAGPKRGPKAAPPEKPEKVGVSTLRQFEHKDTQDLVIAIKDEFPDDFELARRGQITVPETLRRAADITEDQIKEFYYSWKPGTTANAEMMAALAQHAMRNIADMVTDFVKNVSNADLVKFEAVKSEVGRALSILQWSAKTPDNAPFIEMARKMFYDMKTGDVQNVFAELAAQGKKYREIIDRPEIHGKIKELKQALEKVSQRRPC